MAKKKVTRIIKLQLPAGKATPAPPVGTALGPTGVSTPDFVKQYNAATESMVGSIVPVEITIFEDRSFTFVLKTTPTPALIRAAAGIDKGAKHQKKDVAGSITMEQVEEIARTKLPDLNSQDLEAAKAQVVGTARSMGVQVK